MSDTERQGVYVPEVSDLEKFAEIVERTRGLFIKDIPAGTVLQIDAADEVFTVLVVDPAQKMIRVRGSQFLPELTDAILSGSTFGGCMLKEGWLGIGMFLEFFLPDRQLPRLTTSMVQKISVVTGGTSTVQ